MKLSILGATVVLLMLSLCVANAAIVADSVAGFSGVQGGNGWYYGETGLPYMWPGWDWGHPAFGQQIANLYQPGYFTEYASYNEWWTNYWRWTTDYANLVCRDAQCPGYWGTAIRRWVSTVSGPVTISGDMGNWNPGIGSYPTNNGWTGFIIVDGVIKFTQVIAWDTTSVPFVANMSVGLGSKVDFMVCSAGTDGLLGSSYDTAIWHAKIDYVPEPCSLYGLGLGMIGILPLLRRRRS